MLLEQIASDPEQPLRILFLKKLLRKKGAEVFAYISATDENGEYYSPTIGVFSVASSIGKLFSRPDVLFGQVVDVTTHNAPTPVASHWYIVFRDGSWESIPVTVLDEFKLVNVQDDIWLFVNNWLEDTGLEKVRQYLGIKEPKAKK